MSAATAAALHHDDHPAMRFIPYGFFTGPNAEFSFDPHIANSSRLVFPIMHPHACSSFSKHVALYGAINSAHMFEPNVVL
jgi:hypothetical protein